MSISTKLRTVNSMIVNALKPWVPPVLSKCSEQIIDVVNRRRTPNFELPEVELAELFPQVMDSSVSVSLKQLRNHLWGMPENEILVLSAIASSITPVRIVEFGTFTGASTMALAMNSPDDAKIITVDIEPTRRATHVHGLGVGLLNFDVGQVFRRTKWQSKIEQRFCDTRQFVHDEWRRKVDLFFIDADHSYEFVRHDTQVALSMLSDVGVIVWHDYRWRREDRECAGVTNAVNEFYREHGNCYQIAGTRFAIYRGEKIQTQLNLKDIKPVEKSSGIS